jgi:hypothetical protein
MVEVFRGEHAPVYPDVVVRRRGSVMLIADAKYKYMDDVRLPAADDVQQMLTYCGLLRARFGVLAYPTMDAVRPRALTANMYGQPVSLLIAPVRLGGRPIELAASFREMARWVRMEAEQGA